MTAFLTLLDLMGVAAFAVSGGLLAIRRKLDLFGVLVLAIAAALSGGVARDLILGAVPPAAFARPSYLTVALAAGAATILLHASLERLARAVMVFDAIGLGLFAAVGCSKALDAELGYLAAALVGVLTAAGGGMLRDLLVSEVPRVLREEIYAVAAIAAALVVIVGDAAALPPVPVLMAATVVGSAVRILSVHFAWRLPRAPDP